MRSNTILANLGWLPTLTVLAAGVLLGPNLGSVGRLALSTVVLYLALKVAAVVKQRSIWQNVAVEGWLWYWLAWPGMDLKPFIQGERRDQAERSAPVDFLLRGSAGVCVGLGLLLGVVWLDLNEWLTGWVAISGLLALVHFGYADLLSWFMRRRGFRTIRLFRQPEKSRTLNDFWTRRWNVAFVEMDKILFMSALRRISRRWSVVLMLLLSGLLHELALSYSAGDGWGLPMVYFAIHGLLMKVERSGWFRRLDGRIKPWWTRFWVLAPAGLVFHRPFRDAFGLELIKLLQEILL